MMARKRQVIVLGCGVGLESKGVLSFDIVWMNYTCKSR